MSVAPFVQTTFEVARMMIQAAEMKSGEVLYDLGCGDGRLVIIAAKDFGVKAIGIELREDLCERARAEIKRLNLEAKVTIVQADLFQIPISDADVITCYLTPVMMESLRPKLENELKSGARVISHDFEIPGWKASAVHLHEYKTQGWPPETIYVYKIGQQI